jgi:hypothetical protein
MTDLDLDAIAALVKRLRASIRLDTVNGDRAERAVCAAQMREAAVSLDALLASRISPALDALEAAEAQCDALANESIANATKLMLAEARVKELETVLADLAPHVEHRHQPVLADAERRIAARVVGAMSETTILHLREYSETLACEREWRAALRRAIEEAP